MLALIILPFHCNLFELERNELACLRLFAIEMNELARDEETFWTGNEDESFCSPDKLFAIVCD